MRKSVNRKEDVPIGKAKTIMSERWYNGENFRNIHKEDRYFCFNQDGIDRQDRLCFPIILQWVHWEPALGGMMLNA